MIFGVRLMAVLLCSLFCAASVSAQDDVIARARAAASDGRRAEGITLLEQHLAASPRDVDARLVLGLILSWDGQYDRARTELTSVLAQAPDYLDARVALMNVEWWSGHNDAAREQVNVILARDAGNQQARLVQQRLDARTRPWSLGLSYTNDTFRDGPDEPWHEVQYVLGRETPVGSLFLRGSNARRFGLGDQQFEFEFYPKFRAGTYAYIEYGIGADEELYPSSRFTVDFYQSLGKGWEGSIGFRQLNFSETTQIYAGTLTKYYGDWMMTAKVGMVPDQLLGDSWTYAGKFRRYFGGSGRSYYGLGYSHGYSREPRSAGDLILVNGDTVRGEASFNVNERWEFSVSGSSSRQERAARVPLWQNTVGSGLTVRF